MPEQRFHKGDVVEFRLGVRTVRGVVKEDRGPIGVGGRRLYLIEFRADSTSPDTSGVELPAEDLQRVRGKVATG